MLIHAFQSGCWLRTASAISPTKTPITTGTDTATDLMMVARIFSSAVGCLSAGATSSGWDAGSSISPVTRSPQETAERFGVRAEALAPYEVGRDSDEWGSG